MPSYLISFVGIFAYNPDFTLIVILHYEIRFTPTADFLPYCDVDSTVAVVDVFDIRVAELLHCNICVEL